MPRIDRDVSVRFIEALQVLIESGAVESDAAFADQLNLPLTELSEIRAGRQQVTRPWIEAAVRTYRVNPLYLYCNEGRPLIGLRLKLDARTVEHTLSVVRSKRAAEV